MKFCVCGSTNPFFSLPGGLWTPSHGWSSWIKNLHKIQTSCTQWLIYIFLKIPWRVSVRLLLFLRSIHSLPPFLEHSSSSNYPLFSIFPTNDSFFLLCFPRLPPTATISLLPAKTWQSTLLPFSRVTDYSLLPYFHISCSSPHLLQFGFCPQSLCRREFSRNQPLRQNINCQIWQSPYLPFYSANPEQDAALMGVLSPLSPLHLSGLHHLLSQLLSWACPKVWAFLCFSLWSLATLRSTSPAPMVSTITWALLP